METCHLLRVTRTPGSREEAEPPQPAEKALSRAGGRPRRPGRMRCGAEPQCLDGTCSHLKCIDREWIVRGSSTTSASQADRPGCLDCRRVDRECLAQPAIDDGALWCGSGVGAVGGAVG